jgi:hypothetical protein
MFTALAVRNGVHPEMADGDSPAEGAGQVPFERRTKLVRVENERNPENHHDENTGDRGAGEEKLFLHHEPPIEAA